MEEWKWRKITKLIVFYSGFNKSCKHIAKIPVAFKKILHFSRSNKCNQFFGKKFHLARYEGYSKSKFPYPVKSVLRYLYTLKLEVQLVFEILVTL